MIHHAPQATNSIDWNRFSLLDNRQLCQEGNHLNEIIKQEGLHINLPFRWRFDSNLLALLPVFPDEQITWWKEVVILQMVDLDLNTSKLSSTHQPFLIGHLLLPKVFPTE